MGVFSPSGPPPIANVTVQSQLTNPATLRQTIVLADTEDSITLASTVKFYRIRAQGNAKLIYYYTSGNQANAFTLAMGNILEPPGILDLDGSLTIYLESNKANTILEIETWSSV